jgi:predicted dehydrogenase
MSFANLANNLMLKQQDHISVALIGCGAISELFYAPALIQLAAKENLSVGTLVDPDSLRLSRIASLFPSAVCRKSIENLEPSGKDIAIIASPQGYHAEQAISLLHKGFDVLCEKPLASNLHEARSMVSAANKSDRLLAVGLFRRFWPITKYIKDLVSGEDFGAPISFHWSEGGIFGWPAATTSFFCKESSPGGVFADLGAHVVDLLLYWFGSVVDLEYQDDAMGGLETNAVLDLIFVNGVRGKVRLSRDTPIPNFVSIEFERAHLLLQSGKVSEVAIVLKHSDLAVKSTLFQKTNTSMLSPDEWIPTLTNSQSFMEQISNICRAVRGEELLLVPASDALASMALIDQCYSNRRLMSMPWLTLAEQLGAQTMLNSQT